MRKLACGAVAPKRRQSIPTDPLEEIRCGVAWDTAANTATGAPMLAAVMQCVIDDRKKRNLAARNGGWPISVAVSMRARGGVVRGRA
jgi:hypothetical protein